MSTKNDIPQHTGAQTPAEAAPGTEQYVPAKGSQEWAIQHRDDVVTAPAADDAGVKADDTGVKADAAGAKAQNDHDAVMGMDEQIRLLREAAAKQKPETDEQRAQRERKERSQKIWAAVGDGLMSLSNLYFTTKGAPNSYNHQTMSQQTPLERRLAKEKAEREANGDTYLNYSLKIGDLQNQRAKTLREVEAQREAQRLAAEKAKREQEEHGWKRALQPSAIKKAEEDAKAAAQKAIAAKAAADYADELQKAKVATEKARGTAQTAAAGAHRASAESSRASAAYSRARGEAVNPYRVYNKETKRYEHFPTRDAAVTAAQQYGTAVEVVGGSTTKASETPVKNSRGKVTGTAKSTTTTTTRRVIPASKETVEQADRAKAADGKKPSKKKKTGVVWK